MAHRLQLDTVTTPLPMQVLHRPPAAADTLRLYLDGDGTPWRDGQPAADPTAARSPLGLQLFLRDPDAHGYIGRPCYHIAASLPAGCTSALWTSHRYSEEVVSALSGEVRRLAHRYAGRSIELIGYSGGGTLALLVSARVAAVSSVVTIAAPLDPHAWATFHRLLPLSGSMSPLDVARPTRPEELHFMGEKDDVVPPALAHDYRERFPQAVFRVVDGFDHRCCWRSYWPAILQSTTREAAPTPGPQ